MTWGPLAAGYLTGKYTRQNPNPNGARRTAIPYPPIDLELGYEVVDKLTEIASTNDATIAQVALAWILHRPWVCSVIIGASSETQLASNLAAASITLSDSEIDALDRLTAVAPRYPHWPQPPKLTGPDPQAEQAPTTCNTS